MTGANAVRFVLTAFVAVAVFVRSDVLPAPDAVEQVVGTETGSSTCSCSSPRCCSASCEVLYDNSAQTFMPALVADEHLERANGRLYSAETRRQPVRRAAARRPAARRRVRPAVRRRRRHVRRLGGARVLDHRPPAGRSAPTPARGRSGGRRSPRASAGSGTTRCCARWPSRSARSTCSSNVSFAVVRDLRPGGARHVDDGVRHPRRGAGDRRRGRRLGGVAGRQAPRRRDVAAPQSSWVVGADHARSSPSCRPGPSSPRCSPSAMFFAVALERDHGQLPPVGDPRSPARPGQQRLPLLRLGRDPDRRAASAA